MGCVGLHEGFPAYVNLWPKQGSVWQYRDAVTKEQ